jgi:hypothetical protein
VRKAIRAGALFGGRSPGHGSLNPLGFRGGRVARPVHRKSERGGLKRDASSRVFVEGEPERPQRPGEHRAPPWSKPPGKQKGARLLRWESTAGAPMPGREGLAGKGRSGRGKGKLFLRSSGRRKALKGGPQECRELKEALGGRGKLGNHREGSQTLRMELPGRTATCSGRSLKPGE